jgi:hypothetical protein
MSVGVAGQSIGGVGLHWLNHVMEAALRSPPEFDVRRGGSATGAAGASVAGTVVTGSGSAGARQRCGAELCFSESGHFVISSLGSSWRLSQARQGPKQPRPRTGNPIPAHGLNVRTTPESLDEHHHPYCRRTALSEPSGSGSCCSTPQRLGCAASRARERLNTADQWVCRATTRNSVDNSGSCMVRFASLSGR